MSKSLNLVAGEPLVKQVYKAGYEVELCCGQGICGTCRATLHQGEVSYKEKPLACLNPGEILLCCAKPTTDQITISIKIFKLIYQKPQ